MVHGIYSGLRNVLLQSFIKILQTSQLTDAGENIICLAEVRLYNFVIKNVLIKFQIFIFAHYIYILYNTFLTNNTAKA